MAPVPLLIPANEHYHQSRNRRQIAT